ncbi:uncharacterized protein LOC125026244 [Penaeus chinensis]|uniref:uncharacterized protein LOC125026244 n=1 Tax=Penaeus chinensis TaxID=139456 RepID=UPI001FB657F5|nr:uncharacterized protein LOC125026244 [Penaeus chinensis]
MEVKLGLGAPAPHILYPGSRQPPPGPPAAHPPPTSRITARGERLGLAKSDGHDGSPYKTPISPPMASRAGAGGYPAYPPSGDTHGRYIQPPPIQQQPPFVAYPRDQSHYVRNTDRPMMLPHGPRRPTIMGNYGPYSRAEAEMLWPYTHSHPRTDMMSIVPGNPLAISTTIDSSKRMKLSQQMKPLVVDTSENNHSSRESTYTPQVEAISPTLPSDPRDESPLRTTKDDLLKRIEKVDRDIAKAESSIAKLRKKEGELEAAAQKGEGGKTEEEDTKEPKHQSLAQIIYADNRKKAEESHTILDKLMPPTEEPSVLPLYHQPTDTEVYMENKRQYAGFKRRLMEYFKKRHAEKNSRDAHLTQTYSKLMTEWLKKVEKVSSRHGLRRDAGLMAPKLIAFSHTPQNEDKKMRAYAVIPPILLEEKKRQHRYNNRNGLIEEPIAEYKDHKNINIWTEQEKEIFRDKYLQHPKNFVAIGSYLERKSVSDCIQYYYSTKKKENYKVLVKRRIRRPRKPNNPPVVEVVGVNVTGVTTRGSVAALRGQQTNRQGPPTMTGSLNNNSNSNQGSSGESEQPQNYPVNSTPGGEVSANSLPATTENSPVPSPNHAAAVGVSQGNESSNNSGTNTAPAISNQEVREKDKENLSNSDKPREKTARRERLLKEDDKTKDTQDSSDDDNAAEHGKGGPHECVVCNAQLEHFGQSRPVAAGQASRYGLSEAHLPPNPRVCTSCKCRATRVRVRQCPIPTCPTPKWRGKRLRPLPSRWADLPPQIKEPIIKEFQIPSDCTKCCSACHNRITRKLGPDAEEPVDPSRWSDEDLDALRSALREVGCHWSKVAERVPSKTEGQCKSFYFNFKKKYKFDEIVAEYRKARGKGDGPPTVTDEEESGSSTSSCDEGPLPALPAGPDSDTTSAPSPGPAHQNNIDEKREPAGPGEGLMKEPPPPVAPQPPSVREDYDSSATASADEGQSGAGRDSPEVQHIPHPGERKPQHPPAHAKLSATPPTNIVQNPDPSNVRDLIYIAIEKSLEDPCSSNINSKDPPTIESILKASNFGRGQPPQPHAAPARRDFHREQRLHTPGRYNDPRDGLPPSDASAFDTQDTQCEGLDLSVRKRDRSPPPKQPPAHHAHPTHFHHPPQPHQPHQSHQSHQPPPPPPAAPLTRDLPLTVRGGAELTITSKEPPPQAHSNSTYAKPPSHEPWPYADPRNKSPSAFISDARALPHPASSIMTNVAPSGAQPLVYVRPQHTQSSKSKPSMAPPPPLTVRSQHAAQQPVSVASRISVKAEKPLHVGSITHGTPVNPPPIVSVPITQPARFDMMPKSGMGKEGGSITQGTPMHHEQKRISGNLYKDVVGVVYEPRPGSGVEIIPRPSLNPQYEREHSYRGPRPPISSAPPTTTYPYTNYPYAARPPYSESQISSRQIIANDYITSQQMHGRRAVSEKEARVSPRGRDHSPQSDPRDHRSLPGTTSVSRIMEARQVDPRTIDIRTVDHRPPELRGMDHRMAHGMDPRIYYPGGPPHGSYQPPTQPSAPVYHPVDRVSRPPPSPASARDATPTPPTSDPAPSPHDFRSPGVSTPTPPPRVGVIQRRPTSKPPPHAVPPKSISPQLEPNRYSPRHPSGSDNFHAFVDIAVAQRSNVGYAMPEMRREARPPSHHENRQLEGFEKHFTDSVRNVRTIDRDKGERGYYEAVDRHRIAKNPDGKANLEAEVARDMAACFRKDDPKNAQAQKHRNPDETMTAANLIDRIITQQINHNSGDCGTGGGGGGGGGGCSGGSSCGSSGAGGERGGSAGGAGGDQRTYRRDGEVALQVVELDKRVRSPAAPMNKEKEVVMVEDGPEPRPPNPVNHKEGLGASLHAASHHPGSQPKSMQAHLDQVIHRELSSGDGRKMGAPHMPYGRSFEILRTEGRPLVGSGGPPAVTVSQVGYDPWKMRGHDKDSGKERLESRSPHRPPPTTAPPSSHHLSAQHLAPDERQIIRIAQPVSPRPDHKMRTPPAAPAGSFPVEPISPPTSSAQPPADLNHTDPNPPWQRKRPYPPPPQSKEVFEYVRCKIAEVMRTPETQESDKQRVHDDRRPRSGTPVSQHQQQPPPPPPQQSAPQQNAHYDMEDAAKKRARLEAAERPPSRPRSTGGDMVRDRREEAVAAAAAAREEVANSPQSDEMVIDESPRDAHPPSKSGADMGGNKPGGPKGGDCGGDRPSYPPANTVSGSQYPYTYTGFRGHGGPPGAPPPATTASTTSSNANSGRHAQGYEPSVEPVSDDE